MNYVYPKSEFLNGVYTPFKIEDTKIEKLKQSLEKIIKKEKQVIFQTESLYRDGVKVETLSNDKTQELYYKKITRAKYNKSTKNLHIIYDIEQIEPHNFPNLNKYHHIETKEIHQYGDVLLIKNNTHWTICIKYDSKESVEKIYEQVMNII
jgi:plasmid maintenance system killer protein